MGGAEFWQRKAAESRKLAEQARDDLIRDWHLAAERIWLRAAADEAALRSGTPRKQEARAA